MDDAGTDGPSPAVVCRRLIRGAGRAALATVAGGGKGRIGDRPCAYASLVLIACDLDASPLLLISDLADHTRNLRAEPPVSLLIDGTEGLEEPLTGPRATVQGQAAPVDDRRLLDRYLRRHPSARHYAGFADFHLFRIQPVRAHLVAGFGRIDWIEAAALMADPPAAFTAGEADGVARLNAGHADLLDRCAALPHGHRVQGWRATGLDPDGIDLRRGGRLIRLEFPSPIATPESAADSLERMAGAA